MVNHQNLSKIMIVFVISLAILPTLRYIHVHHATETVNYTINSCGKTSTRGYEIGSNLAYFDAKTQVLTIKVWKNCCGTNLSVTKNETTYIIKETQVGTLCRCVCPSKIKIFKADPNMKIVFVPFSNKEIPIEVIDKRNFCGISTNGPCETNDDCMISGCSGQVCQSVKEQRIITTCEWKECYDHKKYGVSCKCVDGKCKWI